jgi:hypothetical protein
MNNIITGYNNFFLSVKTRVKNFISIFEKKVPILYKNKEYQENINQNEEKKDNISSEILDCIIAFQKIFEKDNIENKPHDIDEKSFYDIKIVYNIYNYIKELVSNVINKVYNSPYIKKYINKID